MTPKDWTLLVIAEGGEHPIQPVQLQKALFLIGRNLHQQDLATPSFYLFSPYDYGPFCTSVYGDAEELESEGLVFISRPPETRFKTYLATEAGLQRAATLKVGLSSRATTYLKRVVEFTQTHSFNELVSAIYKAYPEMKANSVFQE
jgi:hypothetical protein